MLLPVSAIATWGAWLVFAIVLLSQLGVPVPASPVLVLAGSSVASGLLPYWHVLGASIVAVVAADFLWFSVARQYGRRILNSLVKISLSLDTAVRFSRAWIKRFGAPLLSVSKFVPGLSLVTAPLLGTTDIGVKAFLAWDLTGALAWSIFWLTVGVLFANEFTALMDALSRERGTAALEIVGAASVAFLTYRWVARARFRRWLAQARITPQQLASMLSSDHPPLVLDGRQTEVREDEPHCIPGALPIDLSSADKIAPATLAHGVVIYCVCPNEATAKLIAHQLRQKGMLGVHVLKGGLDAWERAGYPVEPLRAAT